MPSKSLRVSSTPSLSPLLSRSLHPPLSHLRKPCKLAILRTRGLSSSGPAGADPRLAKPPLCLAAAAALPSRARRDARDVAGRAPPPLPPTARLSSDGKRELMTLLAALGNSDSLPAEGRRAGEASGGEGGAAAAGAAMGASGEGGGRAALAVVLAWRTSTEFEPEL